MIPTDEHIDHLVGRLMAGELTASERAELDAWAASDAAAARYLAQVQEIYDRSRLSTFSPDTDAAWANVRARLSQGGGRVVALPRQERSTAWRVAASVAVLVGAVAAFYFLRSSDEPTLAVETGGVEQRVELAAHTEAVVAPGSRVAYRYDKRAKEMRVTLAGKAYFDVEGTPDTVLVVEAAGIEIRDIGTTFTVDARDGSDSVRVSVGEGIVALFDGGQEALRLTAGMSGGYVRSSGTFFTDEQADLNAGAWADRRFRFEDSELGAVLRDLNKVYAIPVVLDDPSAARCQITVAFSGEDIHTIAAVLAETLGLEVREEAGRIVLSGGSCQE